MPTGEETLEIRKRRGVALEANQTIQSLVYPHGNMDIRLPLWIVEYWLEANYILEAKIQWHAAITWLQQKKSQGTLGLLTQLMLLVLILTTTTSRCRLISVSKGGDV
ncbi:hypothetical protein CPB84DRAFT_1767756 [Gymnopilus junonius]|uniref:Uncharacterized protein n=1 Tax=Gymnopilus junonius TaxID=109634 RepID=A0A9P5TSJ5_GYMJU|nr:hypothetical protein CPB84DRAFT_1767756 [Gymnopilus junonius]